MMKPHEITSKSFEAIRKGIGEHNFSEQELSLVIRMVHTTGDYEYAENARFHPDAIQCGIDAIRAGRPIVSDTRMAQAGMTKARAEGCEVQCFVHDEDVVDEAKKLGVTRSIIAIRKAASIRPLGIVAIGNAPTALMEAIRLIREGQLSPELIVGVPVGFVSAAESKELLIASDLRVPYITALGNKGGSAVAAAIINGLAVLTDRDEVKKIH
ncbi:MAG: precorrin-8X methylmutase [Candidatus Latescibacterota bacterium]|nr:MAG: precorrin-8X methylmutase [Candidatus Latescibacterota bacterium]